MSDRFKAIVVREDGDGFRRVMEERRVEDLPEGEVLVRVHYSSLNYKDALSATGHRGVTKAYPHTPGIDAAGEIVESSTPDLRPGDQVTVTDYDLGMNTPGGWGELIRVPSDWVLPLPEGLTLQESMILGTAGLTAALSVFEITQASVTPDQGYVLVTGSTGGVGSLAVAILSQAGFAVTAATGKLDAEIFLTDLGATDVIDRGRIDTDPDKPLGKGRWAAVLDTVGGSTLEGVLKTVMPRGIVTCCGLVASDKLHTTVYPFILRGVRLIGIDCAECPIEIRHDLWLMLAGRWKVDGIERLARVIGMDEVDGEIERMLAGRSRGRVVIRI